MQRERWYEDFIEGGGPPSNADVSLKQEKTTSAEPNDDEFHDLPDDK